MTEEVETTALCPQCGTLIEVRDVRQLILALHLMNECEISSLLSPEKG
jgi:hypothetical protein